MNPTKEPIIATQEFEDGWKEGVLKETASSLMGFKLVKGTKVNYRLQHKIWCNTTKEFIAGQEYHYRLGKTGNIIRTPKLLV